MARETFKKIITSEDLIEKINPKNKKLMDLYLKDKDRKCSDATIKNYKSDLNIFFCWVLEEAENKYYPELKKFELSDFFSYGINILQWKGKRFARMRSTLSGLSDIVIKYYDEEFPTFKNIINNLIESIPKDAVREKTILQNEDVERLLDYLSNELKNPREACLLALAVYSGSRISELAQFKINSIDVNNLAFGDIMLETTHKIRSKGFGKTGKLIHKYVIKSKFLPYYEKYLEQRKQIIENTNSTTDLLFIQNTGKPAKVSTFNSWKEKWEEYLGNDIYVHCLRHYLVTLLVKQGLSKEIIMAIIGWSSDMVAVYTDIEDKDKDWSKDLHKLESFIK